MLKEIGEIMFVKYFNDNNNNDAAYVLAGSCLSK